MCKQEPIDKKVSEYLCRASYIYEKTIGNEYSKRRPEEMENSRRCIIEIANMIQIEEHKPISTIEMKRKLYGDNIKDWPKK